MAKKTDKKPRRFPDEDGRPSYGISEIQIIDQKVGGGFKFLDNLSAQQAADINYTPEYLQPHINDWVRKARKEFDKATEAMETSDKASDKYVTNIKKRESIARSMMTLRDQLDVHKRGQIELKGVLKQMNKGTDEKNVLTNIIAFTDQADAVEIDQFGKLHFGMQHGEGRDGMSVFKLDDMPSPGVGSTPIITEPKGSMAYVWKLAETINQNKNKNVPFDYDWVYTRMFDELTTKGSNNTIGMAFADLSGDGTTKSFADMYKDGLADPVFYIDPETGKPIPPENEWMKDSNNSELLAKFLSKYISDVMKELYGDLDEKTGKIRQDKTEVAQRLLRKYSK